MGVEAIANVPSEFCCSPRRGARPRTRVFPRFSTSIHSVFPIAQSDASKPALHNIRGGGLSRTHPLVANSATVRLTPEFFTRYNAAIRGRLMRPRPIPTASFDPQAPRPLVAPESGEEMSTLEKLLVLGVLILVGVILAISLFWNRPEIQGAGGGALATNSAGVHNLTSGGNGAPGAGVLPNPPSMESPKPNGGGSQVPGSIVSGAAGPASQPAAPPPTVVLGGNPQGGGSNGSAVNPAGAQPQAAPRTVSSWLNVTVPASVLSKIRPSGSAEFSLYVVQPNDNPEVISRKLTGSPNYARMIDRANEGKKLVSRSEILIPNVIFEDATSKGTIASLEPKSEASPAPNAPVDAGGITVGPGSSSSKKSEPQPSKTAPGVAKTPEKGDAPKSATESVYVVKRGDSLRLIAKRVLKDERRWQEIQQLNRLSSEVIREGQKLKLPAAK